LGFQKEVVDGGRSEYGSGSGGGSSGNGETEPAFHKYGALEHPNPIMPRTGGFASHTGGQISASFPTVVPVGGENLTK